MTDVQIAEPGVYDLPIDVYHADPVAGGSLSHSGARMLLPPNCPAKFAYERKNGRTERKSDWDFGHAAHLALLGTGPELVKVDAADWRTKRAQQQRDEAYARGAVPVLVEQWHQIQAMAEALRAHPLAGKLFDPERMEAERTLVWRDDQTGIWRRALVDSLPRARGGRMLLADYKTAKSAEPERIGRAMADYGYHIQAGWHSDGAHALHLAEDVRFLLVVQEKTPPYLVTVAEPDGASLTVGRKLARQAIDIYVECTRTGQWPGYPTGPDTSTNEDIALVTLPVWEQRKHEEEVW